MSAIQDLIEKIRTYIRKKPWKKLKKADYFVLICIGVLLMVIAMPETVPDGKLSFKESKPTLLSATETETKNVSETEKNDDYTVQMEHKLEKVLSQMEGVGKVKVMITVSDYGTCVLEKDQKRDTTTTTETDSNGGNRAVTEEQREETTVYTENGQEKIPYIQKEELPTIEGVVVVAEGGGNSRTISQISETIQALFPVEAHKIKVVEMSSKEG